MNPQCGYYSQNPQPINGRNCQQQQPNRQTYGAGPGGPSYRQGSVSRMGSCSTNQLQANRAGPNYGGNAVNRTRAPPVFSSMSSGNFYQNQTGFPGQAQSQYGCTGGRARPRQNTGRSNQFQARPCSNNNNNYQAAYQQQAQYQPQRPQPSAPTTNQQNGQPQFCTPQAIKINVTADQLQNAKNSPIYQDRGEATQDGNGKTKYIQLNWQDLLGGMDNLRVSMAPSSDSNNPNRQLKVSFGGQKTDPPQAGETPLKVLSIQPAQTTERMEMRKGNAFAGHMKVCSPPSSMRMSPAQLSPGGGNYGQNGGNYRGGSCRR